MELWTLMENTSCREDLCCEHGLSLYIETGKHKLLLDAGQSGGFADNAEAMGIDLSAVDMAIVSHGHYDHGGGLGRFLELNDTAPIYVSRHAFEPHYNAAEKYIGLDPALRESGRLVFAQDRQRLDRGLTLYGSIPTPTEGTFGLTVEENGVLLPEDFRHEQYLLIEEEGKRILLSGCSHRGILQIAEHFRPDVLIGGFHFMKLDPDGEALRKAAKALLELPTVYYTGHCTGQAQYAALKRCMGSRLHAISAGTRIKLEKEQSHG